MPVVIPYLSNIIILKSVIGVLLMGAAVVLPLTEPGKAYSLFFYNYIFLVDETNSLLQIQILTGR